MTLDDARDALGRPGVPRVLYRPAPMTGPPEVGVIRFVSDRFVFVRFGDAAASQATDPADLELLAAE